MNEPRRDTSTPGTADIDIDVDSSATVTGKEPADEPALTTSQDAQREDLTVRPDNS